MYKVGIVGATGFAGAELLRILANHPDVEVTKVVAKFHVDKRFDEVFENFGKICEDTCLDIDLETLAADTDVIFLALPAGLASKEITESVLSHNKVIDFGADFRLKSKEIYEQWYKTEHFGEQFLGEAVYGLCEWKREEIKNARLIANPGCYTTCSILSLSPLLKEGVIQEDSIIVDAKSGVSGAGRYTEADFAFCEVNESIKAYKIGTHRHTPEIEQQLSEAAGQPITILFTPHLTPMNRGILATCYATLKEKLDYDQIQEIYEKYYKDEFFIRLCKKDKLPETRWVKGSNFYDVGFVIDPRTNHIVVVGALDNLVKGASGQAVQNMNIALGLDEKTALKMPPMFP